MRFEDYSHVPDHFYRNHLPHFDPKDAPYFVTYRLAGSIPQDVLRQRFVANRNSPLHTRGGRVGANSHSPLPRVGANSHSPHDDFLDFDRILDANGPYHLQHPEIRALVRESLDFLGREQLYMYAYCLMPNHVHAVFNVRSDRKLYEIMQTHKIFTAKRANATLGVRGLPFWADETYDHVIRDGKLGNAIWYTILNPVKAGFVKQWEDWPGTYLSPDCHGFATV